MTNTNTADQSERDALIALSLLDGIRNVTLRKLQAGGFSFAHALRQLAPGSELRRLQRSARVAEERALSAGAQLITFLDADYPRRLHNLTDPPILLYAMGKRSTLDRISIAIVGTRSSTRYGESVAHELSSALAAAGACIVSGLARGIDSSAHRGALDASGHTCAVLGTGIDLAFPVENTSLQRTIASEGYVLSELPPRARPGPGSFPRRNRIIAALAQMTIVVEAGRKSGARYTAEYALALGRTVAAVPGRIDSMQSVLCNDLLKGGAQIICGAEDALSLAGLRFTGTEVREREHTPAEAAVFGALSDRELTTQQIVEVSQLPVSECLAAISSLEIDGFIEVSFTGEFRRCMRQQHNVAAFSSP